MSILSRHVLGTALVMTLGGAALAACAGDSRTTTPNDGPNGNGDSTGHAGKDRKASGGGDAGASSSSTSPQFALYGQRSVTLGNGDQVIGGSIGVASAAVSSFGSQVIVGNGAVLDPKTVTIVSPTTTLDHHATVGAIETNSLTSQSGAVHGAVTAYPVALPSLPLAPSLPAGSNVTVSTLKTISLAPGNYGTLTVADGAKVTLAAGTYSFSSVTIGNGVTFQSAGAGVTLEVSGALAVGNGNRIGPVLGSSGTFTILVAGNDIPPGAPGCASSTSPTPVVQIGSGSAVNAVVAAPHGTLAVASGVQLEGAFAAFDVAVEPGVEVIFQYGLPTGAAVGQQGSQPIGGEVPVGLGTVYPVVGPLPSSTVVSLSIGLPLLQTGSNTPGLPSLPTFIQQVSDPTSATYRQYLTPDSFATAYGPSVADYRFLQDFAQANGLTVTRSFTSRSLLSVTGPASAVQNAFFVGLNQYARPDGSTFYAPANTPSYNLALSNPILHVSGLDNLAVAYPSGGNTATGSSTKTCHGLLGFFGADLRNLYVPCATYQAFGPPAIEGAGQTIALVELDGFSASNITAYAAGTNLGTALYTHDASGNATQVQAQLGSNVFQEVVAQSGTVTPGPAFASNTSGVPLGAGEPEVEVGIEMALAMAPAAQIVVYEQNTAPAAGGFQPAPLLEAIADHRPSGTDPAPAAQVIANSWTWTGGGPDLNIIQTFQQFATQGQSFFQASGDLGAYVAGSSGMVHVPEPIIDSSLMTVVGGTEFTVGTTRNETTWNDPTEQTPFCTVGAGQQVGGPVLAEGACNSVSGGGFVTGYTSSGAFPSLKLPLYQQGVGVTTAYDGLPLTVALSPHPNPNITSEITALGTQPLPRMIPDVSIVANDLATYTVGGTSCSYGTSASAVLWAAYTALANSSSSYGAPAGFINPSLYLLASQNQSPLSDIGDSTTNSFMGSTPYTAYPGYDLATGLGSPAGTKTACTTATTSLPPQSCLPGTSLSVLFGPAPATGVNTSVVAYMPNGSYGQSDPGVVVVPIEGPLTSAGILPQSTTLALGTNTATDPNSIINTCAANSSTGQVVCTSNGTSVYVINTTNALAPTVETPALTDSAQAISLTGTLFQGEHFSGGNCSTCNVAIDPLHNVAFLSIGQSDGTAAGTANAFFQPLNLATTPPTLGTPIAISQASTSEDVVVDPVRGLILSPNEQDDYQLINTTTGAVFNMTPPTPPASIGGGVSTSFDSAGEDCQTGIALSTDEFSENVLLTDLSQVTFPATGAGAGTTWSAPSSYVTIPEAYFLGAGTSGISVVASGSHVAAIAGEFGSAAFIALNLPPTKAAPGTAPPTTLGYIQANIPNTPDNVPWAMGDDPHTLTAYTSPNTGDPHVVFEDNVFASNGNRTWVAVVDLKTVLNATRGSGPFNSAAPAQAGTSTADANQTAAPLTCCQTPAANSGNPSGCAVRFVCVNPPCTIDPANTCAP